MCSTRLRRSCCHHPRSLRASRPGPSPERGRAAAVSFPPDDESQGLAGHLTVEEELQALKKFLVLFLCLQLLPEALRLRCRLLPQKRPCHHRACPAPRWRAQGGDGPQPLSRPFSPKAPPSAGLQSSPHQQETHPPQPPPPQAPPCGPDWHPTPPVSTGKKQGCRLQVGGLVWEHGHGGEGGAVTVLGHQWAWVPRASPEPTHLAMHNPTAKPVTTLLRGDAGPVLWKPLSPPWSSRSPTRRCPHWPSPLCGPDPPAGGQGEGQRERMPEPPPPCGESRAMAPAH